MSQHAPLELRILPITELVPAPYNPRKALKFTDPAYRKLRQSLVEFGLVEPLIWNATTGRVVGGHARLRILQELGYTEVPVSVVRLTETREKALNVLLNNQEAQGRYDTGKLADLLTELQDLPEMELTGFDSRMLTDLRFEPVATPPVEDTSTQVEIVMLTNAETFAQLENALDALVREFHLVTHVRVGGTDTAHKPKRTQRRGKVSQASSNSDGLAHCTEEVD
ncbi:MAG: ParB N-terminal domain-containing protein [Bacteroidales bacterium]|nr:ParB N-terminal domain-containing protein [Bacteroidales bacterium]